MYKGRALFSSKKKKVTNPKKREKEKGKKSVSQSERFSQSFFDSLCFFSFFHGTLKKEEVEREREISTFQMFLGWECLQLWTDFKGENTHKEGFSKKEQQLNVSSGSCFLFFFLEHLFVG